MAELIGAIGICLIIPVWLWAVLDIAARPRRDVPKRHMWLAACVVSGPLGAAAWLLRRQKVGPLPRVDVYDPVVVHTTGGATVGNVVVDGATERIE